MPLIAPNNVQRLSPKARLSIDTQFPPTPPNSGIDGCRPSNAQREMVLQKCWDKSIAKHMDLPDGYHNVHVLMVKWHDDIDQLKVRQEVNELTKVFRDIFEYGVTEVQLKATKAQHQLDMEIATWIYKHDGPNNLLIVYYGGHGVYDQNTKALEILPDDGGTHERVSWTRSEKPFIETVEADVFSIMDCCYASDVLRNVFECGRTFEMLAASQIGQTTPQPGEDSFTSCLTKHLKELAVESDHAVITTLDIQERMQRERKDEAPALWRRIPGNSRHIRLRKLKPIHERPRKDNDRPEYAQFLQLGFALRNETLQEAHIERLTKELPALFARIPIPLVDIKWLGCRKASSSRFKEAVHWVMVKNRGSPPAVYSLDTDYLGISSAATAKKRDAGEAGLDEEV